MSPFKLSKEKAFHIQSYLPISLIPIIMWGVYVFGSRVITLCLISVAFSVLTEFAFFLAIKRKDEFYILKPIIIGALSSLIFPVTTPVWIAALGGFIASSISLISFNSNASVTIINPIAAAGLILHAFFKNLTSKYTLPFDTFSIIDFNIEDINHASTILQTLKSGTDNITSSTILNIFLGRESGAIGEVSALLIIISCVVLIFKKYITWHIPATFISSVFLMSFFLPVGNCETIYCAAAETLSGGVLFMAVFIATLPYSAPITKSGKLIFGFGCGILTITLQRVTHIADGSLLAVAIMSCFSGIIERFTGNKYFSYLADKKQSIKIHETNLEELLKD